MKLQYLGDSKDSFKWDYHDYMVTELGYPLFNIALMLTPDDGGNDGKSHPSIFPARMEIIEFCHRLRKKRSIESIKLLPATTGALYEIAFHMNIDYFNNSNRIEYFSGLNEKDSQVLLLDPDNGFEPEKSLNKKHVSYSDISKVLAQISEESVVSVFQHQRRKSFNEDFLRIRERIQSGYTTAIYWHSLMFVAISKSEQVLNRVMEVNEKYAKTKARAHLVTII